MNSELDYNKIVAEFISNQIDRLLVAGKSVYTSTVGKIELRLEKTYKEYLTNLLNDYSYSKSFFVRDEPQKLYKFFVNLSGVCNREIIEKINIKTIAHVNSKIIISGQAGCGKSIISKHLLVNSIVHKTHVPIYVELRRLNGSKKCFEEFVFYTLKTHGVNLKKEYLEKSLELGHFLILLDGFDELEMTIRDAISSDIKEFVERYSKNTYVLTTRPDERVESWDSFSVIRVQPLDLEKAIELVSKLPFNSDEKKGFIELLQGTLFDSHRSFLSNPLLLTIMILTYRQSADIPKKLSIFYWQAYEALFQRHDSFKGAYCRDRICSLDIQDFSKVFSAFCVHTYDDNKYSFARDEILKYFKFSTDVTGLDVEPEGFLKDCLQAVCLIVEDGLFYTFTHRSFQEYFAAKFIVDCPPDVKGQLLDKFSDRSVSDSVLSLVYEMDTENFEKLFLIPFVDELIRIAEIENDVTNVNIENIISYLEFTFRAKGDGELPPGKSYRTSISSPNYKLFHNLEFVAKLLELSVERYEWFSYISKICSLHEDVENISEGEHVNVRFYDFAKKEGLLDEFIENVDLLNPKTIKKIIDYRKSIIAKHEAKASTLSRILLKR